MDLLFLSGIPASGKSYFGSWMENNHAFLHLDVEKDGRLDSLGLKSAWDACFSDGVAAFVAAVKNLGRSTIVNWGFPPDCLRVVELLKAEGFTLWWFDADRSAARLEFVTRGHISTDAFDTQVAAIDRRWSDLRATFEPNLLETLRADGTRLDPEEIYRRINISTDRGGLSRPPKGSM